MVFCGFFSIFFFFFIFCGSDQFHSLLETLIKINPSQIQPGWEKLQDNKQLKDKNSCSSFECHESLTLPNNLHIFSMLIHAQSSPLLIAASHLVLLFLSLQQSSGGSKDAQPFV